MVDSAGTESYHIGEPPHKSSQKVCKAHGIDISHQRARRFTAADLQQYDKIYAFAADVMREIKRICGPGADLSNVDYFLNELEPGSNASVTDPWYGTEEGYLPVYEQIEKTCTLIINRYK